MNNFTKVIMLISTVVLLIGGGLTLYFTMQSYQPKTIINTNEQGLAIEGFDAVAYHISGKAQKGVSNFQITWSGSTWYFSSLENRQAFSDNPERYAPQYGGYDPYGIAMNGTVQSGTPELWTIEDDMLYLFYSGNTRKLWQEKREENLKNANIQWNKLKQQIQYQTEIDKKPVK